MDEETKALLYKFFEAGVMLATDFTLTTTLGDEDILSTSEIKQRIRNRFETLISEIQ